MKKIWWTLLALIMAEWILIMQPIVEVGSSYTGVVGSFAFYEFQDSGLLKTIVNLLHILSLIALVVPVIKKDEIKGKFFIPAIITAAVSAIIYIVVAAKMDSLMNEAVMKGLVKLTRVDISLTVASTVMVIVAVAVIVICVLAFRSKQHIWDKSQIMVQEKKENKPEWKGPLFEKGNIRQAFVVLVTLCLATSLGLLVPVVIRSLLPNAIVGSWYEKGGNTPYITFHSNDTCEIKGYYGTNKWDVEDGKLIITTVYGETLTCIYEWDGNDLIINGNTFTREPNG